MDAGKKAPEGHIPFTPRSKKTLELALREALALGHNYIGTEHILLGLVREADGVGRADHRGVRARARRRTGPTRRPRPPAEHAGRIRAPLVSPPPNWVRRGGRPSGPSSTPPRRLTPRSAKPPASRARNESDRNTSCSRRSPTRKASRREHSSELGLDLDAGAGTRSKAPTSPVPPTRHPRKPDAANCVSASPTRTRRSRSAILSSLISLEPRSPPSGTKPTRPAPSPAIFR